MSGMDVEDTTPTYLSYYIMMILVVRMTHCTCEA